MVHLHGASSWCIFMVYLHGASSWCIFMVYLHGASLQHHFFLKDVPVPYLWAKHICSQIPTAHTHPQRPARRGVGKRFDSKKRKKNSLDGTNLPSPNQKTSRTFTPKALHPNRTNR
jgi:hypothetical protein